jgi:predicted Zn-dependent protease
MPKQSPKAKKLPHPDAHFLDAAVGWIELGAPREALKELDQITAELQNDPQVLEVRWQVFARTDSWDKSLPVAQEFCKAAPGLPQGWLHQAVSLYRLNRTQEAWNLLLPFAQKFPRSWIIPYDLACYACQLAKVDEGRHWLRRAFRLGDAKEVKLLALADPDLKMLWPEIQSGQWDNLGTSDASAEPAEPAK